MIWNDWLSHTCSVLEENILCASATSQHITGWSHQESFNRHTEMHNPQKKQNKRWLAVFIPTWCISGNNGNCMVLAQVGSTLGLAAVHAALFWFCKNEFLITVDLFPCLTFQDLPRPIDIDPWNDERFALQVHSLTC